jgi:hypothetical protein
MNGNVQAWSMTQLIERKLAKLDKSGRMHEMPPVLAMQSVVDSTVEAPKLITVLFDRLKSDLSELFLFDINREDWLGNLFNKSFEQKIFPKLKKKDLPYRLSVLTNKDSPSGQLQVQTRDGDSWLVESTDLWWPKGVVSLSHVAIPFPDNDAVYGMGDSKSDVSLGSLNLKAEPSDLLIPVSLFVRCRYNPFYRLMENRVIEWYRKVLEKP